MAVEKKFYEVKKTGPALRIAGARRTIGEKIELMDAEAQFLLLDGVIALASETAPAPKAASKSKAGD